MTLAESRHRHGLILSRALAAAGIKHEAAARMMGIPASQFSRQIHGLEHTSSQRLMLIDDPLFWRTYLSELRAEFGVVETTDAVAHALLQLTGQIVRANLEVTAVREAWLGQTSTRVA